jgi:hypothetical protein
MEVVTASLGRERFLFALAGAFAVVALGAGSGKRWRAHRDRPARRRRVEEVSPA